MQKNLAVGMLAHVDAGKTTLAEGMLFQGGLLRRLGRVDHRDAFLDTGEMERKRGITIFAKQAVLPLGGATLTLLDTPGHVDFSAETERVLPVLDYAILIISASDGVQGHTRTLWRLLERYQIPTFLFINKMDLPDTDARKLLAELKSRLHAGCVRFSGRQDDPGLYEDVALCDEATLSRFLQEAALDEDSIASLIQKRLLFPCFFGSALKLEGVGELLEALTRYTRAPRDYATAVAAGFGARVYKISRDRQNNRLTHLKITSGSLGVKASVSGLVSKTSGTSGFPEEERWTEKVNQIRVYSGEKYSAVEEVFPGAVCAVTGLSSTFPGQGLGVGESAPTPMLEPVLSYRVLLPEGCDAHGALRQLRHLEEEDPQLAVSWSEQAGEIHLRLMGGIQLEILGEIIAERFGLQVGFDTGAVLYRETIAGPVTGVGHFEPLRHYAEVHLLLEPGPRGSGLRVDTACSEDLLARSWQRLILTHLKEREHAGVLTGSPVTDLKITLLAGKAHHKHTGGGDFRQATYRAVRQGLMQAESVLLEPWYRFELEIPNESVGRAMTDLQRMTDDVSPPGCDGERTVLTGSAPVSAMRGYAAEVSAYTRGMGRLSCALAGFASSGRQGEIVAETGYDAARDTDNPADSVFCAHGAGFTVPWNQVKTHAHLNLDCKPQEEKQPGGRTRTSPPETGTHPDIFELDRELQAIYEQTYGPVKRQDLRPREKTREKIRGAEAAPASPKPPEGPGYLLVDGYNIIHAWADLYKIARENMDAARQVLMDILSNYSGFRSGEVILVFDAYKVPGGTGSVQPYHNIHVVYTKEAETADTYIEKVTAALGKKHFVRVATSDGTVQMIILGQGALRLTPQGLREEIEQTNADIRELIRAGKAPRFTPVIRAEEAER